MLMQLENWSKFLIMLKFNQCVLVCLCTVQPQYAPEEVLYEGSIKFSNWDEQLKKCRERYIILRRDYKAEIHDSMEVTHRLIRLHTAREICSLNDLHPVMNIAICDSNF